MFWMQRDCPALYYPRHARPAAGVRLLAAAGQLLIALGTAMLARA